ncbi:hypothetical protein V6N13_009978 [Hibiscus sabdariffa]
MCKCRSQGTFPLFGLQSSHLNICYYHQDLHRRPLRPGSRPGFYSDRRALILIGAWPLSRRPGIGHALKRHPFSGLVDSAVGHRNPDSGSSRIASSAYQKWPTWSSRFRGTAQRSSRAVLPIQSLRIGRGRCAPDASNHWLYPIELAKGSSYPEGNFGGNQLLDDSLVRVSRRAGWGAHRPTPGARWCRSTPRRCVLGSMIEVTTSPRAYQRPGLGPPPRSASVHAPSRSADRLSPFHIRPERIAGPHPLPSRQFQALFDSHFKVLFNFPSRYFFAIGSGNDGAFTLSGAPFQGTWARSAAEDASPDYNLDAEGDQCLSWAILDSLAVTKGILAGFDNDPSAGSPTETMLRLLLPLNDKVQWTSRDVAGSEPPTSPRSEHFTGPFNRINQVAFLRDVRLAWSSTHYLGRGEAITRREHRSCRGTKCTSYERTGPRPYAHEIFRIRKNDRASMHRRSRIMSIDKLGTPSTTEVHQAATRSLDGQGMAIHPKFHRFRYATQDPYRTPWARRPQGEDIEE